MPAGGPFLGFHQRRHDEPFAVRPAEDSQDKDHGKDDVPGSAHELLRDGERGSCLCIRVVRERDDTHRLVDTGAAGVAAVAFAIELPPTTCITELNVTGIANAASRTAIPASRAT